MKRLQKTLTSPAIFPLIWLCVGFSLGTVLLLFVVRKAVDYVRQNNSNELLENVSVWIALLVLVAVSLFISIRLYRWHRQNYNVKTIVGALVVPATCFFASVFAFMSPNLLNQGSKAEDISAQFTIGPYPTDDIMQSLSASGYTGIISLLHSAVVPFEPSLLATERELCKRYGIQLIEAPMLPWLSDNSSSMKIIEDIARKKEGKYYIHCYLGKDRVNVARKTIKRVAGDDALDAPEQTKSRSLNDTKIFERGPVYVLAPDVFMTPYPTDEEFLAFFLAGDVQTVVNLMDSTIGDNKPWIRGERRELQRAQIAFLNFPINERTTRDEMLSIIDSIKALPKPVIIHHWNNKSPEPLLFMEAFSQRSGK